VTDSSDSCITTREKGAKKGKKMTFMILVSRNPERRAEIDRWIRACIKLDESVDDDCSMDRMTQLKAENTALVIHSKRHKQTSEQKQGNVVA